MKNSITIYQNGPLTTIPTDHYKHLSDSIMKLQEENAQLHAELERHQKGNKGTFFEKKYTWEEVHKLKEQINELMIENAHLIAESERYQTAQAEGRLILIEKRPPMPQGCILHYRADENKIARCKVDENTCEGYCGIGDEPHVLCQKCEFESENARAAAALKKEKGE